MKSLNKKAQVQTLAPAVLALVFAGIVLVFGIVMSQELRDIDTLKSAASVANETGGYLNTTGYTLDSEVGSKTNNFAITEVWNVTTILLSGNYSVDSGTGVVSNASTTTYANVTISYTYDTGEEAWDASNNTVAGLGAFADFWEIIVLAIVITVVIGLLLIVFGGRRGR